MPTLLYIVAVEQSQATVPDDRRTPDAQMVEPDELEAALTQLGDTGGFVRIYKEPAEGGPMHVAEKIAVGSFDLFTVARRWGGGKFRFQFCDAKGRAVKNATRVLLEPPPQPSAGDSTNEMRELRTLLETQRRDHSDFMAKMLTTLLANQGGAAVASAGPTLQDFATIMREAREAAAATQTPAETMGELIKLGIELRNNAGDGGEDESMFSKLAPRVLDLIQQLSKPANAAGATPLPAAAGVDPDLAALIREFAPKIIAEAQAGRDPYAWGSFVAERTPEAWLPNLQYICTLSPADRRELFARLDPRVTPYMAWLDEAAEGVSHVLSGDDGGGGSEDGEIDPDSTGGARQSADAAPNA